jgi:hypothetical protein
MRLPGFYADSSLYKTRAHYRTTGGGDHRVITSERAEPSSGPRFYPGELCGSEDSCIQGSRLCLFHKGGDLALERPAGIEQCVAFLGVEDAPRHVAPCVFRSQLANRPFRQVVCKLSGSHSLPYTIPRLSNGLMSG